MSPDNQLGIDARGPGRDRIHRGTTPARLTTLRVKSPTIFAVSGVEGHAPDVRLGHATPVTPCERKTRSRYQARPDCNDSHQRSLVASLCVNECENAIVRSVTAGETALEAEEWSFALRTLASVAKREDRLQPQPLRTRRCAMTAGKDRHLASPVWRPLKDGGSNTTVPSSAELAPRCSSQLLTAVMDGSPSSDGAGSKSAPPSFSSFP